MSYKPLSQTVTDGQKNPISSDAVHDHVASEIAAIPSGANDTLSNLSSPTAVNQNLNMGTNQLRFNSANRSSSISINALADVATGITTSANNATTINTSASITDVLQIGDVIYLNGLTPRAVVLTKPSSTQITVSRGLGDNTSREIYIEPQLLSVFDSTTNRLSITKQGYFSFASPNTSLIIKTSPQLVATGANNTIIGSGTTGNALTTGASNTIIGDSAGAVLTTGELNVAIGKSANFSAATTSNSIAIGNLATAGSESVVIGSDISSTEQKLKSVHIGGRVNSKRFGGTFNNIIGFGAFSSSTEYSGNYNTALGGHTGGVSEESTRVGAVVATTPEKNVYIGYAAGSFQSTTKNAIAIGGAGATATSNNIAFGSVSSSYNTVYFGKGEYGIDRNGEESTAFKITTHKGRLTDQNCLGSLVVAGAAGTGTGLGSAVALATAPAGASSGVTVNKHVQRLRIEQDGNVGIGIHKAEAKLEVAGKTRLYDGDLEIASLGKGLKIAEGADATMGVVTLVAGTATVSTAAVKSNSRIMLTNQNPGGTVGFLHVSARTADTNFVITSSEAADTSDVAWMIVNPMTVTDSDADTFITNASITDATQKRAIQRLVKSLKDESLWAKMKVIYPMVGGTEAAHKLNLKDPQDTDAAYRLTFSNANIEHNSRGIKFGGTSPAFADTKFNPSTQLTSINDCHVSLYCFYDTDSYQAGNNSIPFGGGIGAARMFWRFDRPDALYYFADTTTTMRTDINNYPTASRPKSNFFMVNSGASDIRAYMRTLENDLYEVFERKSSITGSFPNLNLYLNAVNDNGSAGSYWTGTAVFKTMQFVTIGDSLTNLEAYKLHAIIEQFQLELGRQV